MQGPFAFPGETYDFHATLRPRMSVAALPDNDTDNARLAALHRSAYSIRWRSRVTTISLALPRMSATRPRLSKLGGPRAPVVQVADRRRKDRDAARARLLRPRHSQSGGALLISDTALDARFADDPLVTGEPRIRFYLGMPLVTPDRYARGTLCIMDHVPRTATSEQIDCLDALARQASSSSAVTRNSSSVPPLIASCSLPSSRTTRQVSRGQSPLARAKPHRQAQRPWQLRRL